MKANAACITSPIICTVLNCDEIPFKNGIINIVTIANAPAADAIMNMI